MIKIVSIGIIIGFILVLYGVDYYFYKKDKDEHRKFNLDLDD